MSHLLEALGRGLPAHLADIFRVHLPDANGDLAHLERRCAQSPTSLDLGMQLGAAYLHLALLPEARQVFTDLHRQAPQAVGPWIGRACVAAELGRWDEARTCLERAARLDTQDPVLELGIGLCCECTGDAAEAGEHYRRARARFAGMRSACERLAALAIVRHDWREAAERYNELAAAYPDDMDVWLTLAALYLQSGQARRALQAYQQALLVEPEAEDDDPQAFDALHDEEQIRTAVRALEEMVETYPDVTELRVHLADMYVRLGQDESAITQYQAALALQPSFLEATIKLGAQHVRQRRYRQAARAFARATVLNERLLVAFAGLGVAQQAAGAVNDARATVDLVAGLAPNGPLLLGETLRLLRSAEACGRAAVEEPGAADELSPLARRFEQVLRRRPDDATLHYHYGLLQRQLGAWQAARAAFQQAVRLVPAFPAAQIQLGVCCREAGDADEALALFRRALLVDAASLPTQYELVMLHHRRDPLDEALEAVGRTRDAATREALRANLPLLLHHCGVAEPHRIVWETARRVLGCRPDFSPEDRFGSQRPFRLR